MKKMIFAVMLLIKFSITAETDFYGSAEISVLALVPADNYDSLINPNNSLLKLNDMSIINSVIFRIDSYDEKSNFESMFKLQNYPVGSFLYNPADPQSDLVKTMLTEVGESVISLEIYRLFIDYSLLENLYISIGRKQYFMGYGYGWNPADNLNPLKNPEDPDAELQGVDSISLEWNMDNILNGRVIAAFNKKIFNQGVNYNELIISSDISLILEGLEVLLTGNYNFNQERDEKVNSFGFAFKKDIFGLGLYGEGILLDGSRNKFTDGISTYYKEEPIFNYLVGLEYLFPTETNLILEFLYNGEGYNESERKAYEDLLILSGGLEVLHRNSNYSRQYLLINLVQSFYDYNTTLNFSSIFNIDTFNITLAPSAEFSISENMDISIEYYGTLDLSKDDLTESKLSPVKHGININFKYSF